MKIPVIIGLSVALASCAGIGQPLTPSATVTYGVVSTGLVVDTAYHEAGRAFLDAAPHMTAANKAAAQKSFAKILYCPPTATVISECTGALALAVEARKTLDQKTFTEQLNSVGQLIADINRLIHPGVPIAAVGAAELAQPQGASR